MLDTSLSPWPVYSEEEAEAVRTVLLSGRVNYWTGEECRLFEQEFGEATGCEHAIAVANGTLALEIALRALGIGPGDEVVVTPRSFIASASCVVTVGATPVFADVDPDSQNITAESIAAVLTPGLVPSSAFTSLVGPARWIPSWSWLRITALMSWKTAPRPTALTTKAVRWVP